MTIELSIPALGAGMSEGKLVQWHVADGETVAAGQIVYTLESEKTAQDIEAPAAGTLKRIGEEGEIYPVGAAIGRIES
ncbi:lipoyl domain-containing protein [Brevundimonas sp.]|uniref:lipoyl domain-containing protein n=1 Tax=Brevundimonas sp. TaxID=1871086 RepID=UPI0028976DC3|nr:lipoyl domain-containing protein [Brevundimonas sp.]